MTLNMKKYKGDDKKSYYVAHYTTIKSTAGTEIPEMVRLAHDTKLHSQVHKD